MISLRTDSPTGMQWHVRYTPYNGDKGPYWSGIFYTLPEAERELAWYHKSGYTDAKLFVRDVSPWREQQT